MAIEHCGNFWERLCWLLPIQFAMQYILVNTITLFIIADINWKVNFDRFHQDFRDDIMIEAITRRIDENGKQT